MTGKYQNKSMQARNGGIGRFTGRMDLDAGLTRYREALHEADTFHTVTRAGAFAASSSNKWSLYRRMVKAVAAAAVILLMTALFAFTGVAQCAECGPLRLTSGQGGGDLAAYLVGLYCGDGSESRSRFILLTPGDESCGQPVTEQFASLIAASEGTLAVVAGGGAAVDTEQETPAQYTGEMDTHGKVHFVP